MINIIVYDKMIELCIDKFEVCYFVEFYIDFIYMYFILRMFCYFLVERWSIVILLVVCKVYILNIMILNYMLVELFVYIIVS